ncbi:hypothetical protein YC2023_113846 [Brassica napus]
MTKDDKMYIIIDNIHNLLGTLVMESNFVAPSPILRAWQRLEQSWQNPNSFSYFNDVQPLSVSFQVSYSEEP